MSFNKIFIFEKIKFISEYVEELKELLQFSNKEILENSGRLHIAERLIQLIVDTMLDVNQHFIKELNLKEMEDFQSTFTILGDNKILSKNFANKIAPVVGVRNRLVHRYEKIDRRLFVKNVRNNYADFEKYMKLIKNYLDRT